MSAVAPARTLRANEKAPAALLGTTGAFLAIALPLVAIILPTAVAPLGPIDDHEIVQFSRRVMPTFIEETRFRPLYYLLRLGETGLWGTNPSGWGFDRLLLAIVTVALAAAIARRYVSEPIAILAGLLVVIGPQAEAFYRFGPQEAYAMPMLLGAVWGILTGRSWLLILAVVAAFTKETFGIATLLVVGLAWLRGYRHAAILAAIGVVVALVGVAIAAINGGTASSGGRYLLPWLLIPLAGAVWLARRFPRATAVAMSLAVVVGFVMAETGAQQWAGQNRDFQAQLADIRSTMKPGVPLIVDASAGNYERALTLRIWIPDGEAMLRVEPGSGVLWNRLESVSQDGGYGYVSLR